MTVEDLKNYGANVDEGLMRCMNKDDFYLKLVRMVPIDNNFNVLEETISNKDYKGAFDAAHALKGSTSNLALTPLSSPLSEITELLRAETETDYTMLMDKIIKAKDNLAALCGIS